MEYIRTSKEILKEWIETNMNTHTDGLEQELKQLKTVVQ